MARDTYAQHDNPALREHRRRFRVSHRESARLATVLDVLEVCEQPIQLALERVCVGRPAVTPTELRAAIRLLVYGPKGEFR